MSAKRKCLPPRGPRAALQFRTTSRNEIRVAFKIFLALARDGSGESLFLVRLPKNISPAVSQLSLVPGREISRCNKHGAIKRTRADLHRGSRKIAETGNSPSA